MNHIHIVDSFLSVGECNTLMKAIDNNSDKTYSGQVGRGLDETIKCSTDVMALDVCSDKFIRLLYKKVDAEIDNYIAKYISNSDGESLTGDLVFDSMQIQRYTKNKGHYNGEHFEVSANQPNRFVSWLFYLNTVEEGGETEFPLLNVKSKAIQGRLVIFPSGFTHIHKGNMPISEDKYIMTAHTKLNI